MNEVYFIIEGDLVPWKRPRFNGKSKHVYEDATVKSWKERVREAYHSEAGNWMWEKDIPLECVVNIYFNVPVSASKSVKKKLILFKRPTKRPDNDNAYKGITDALNSIAYYDDSQIVDTRVRKFWAEQSRTEVIIREVKI